MASLSSFSVTPIPGPEPYPQESPYVAYDHLPGTQFPTGRRGQSWVWHPTYSNCIPQGSYRSLEAPGNKKQEIPQDPAQPKGVEYLQFQPLEETRQEDLEFKANLGYVVGLCLQKNKQQKNSHRSCLTQALAVREEIIRQVASWNKSDSEDNYTPNKDLVLPGRD